MNSQRPFEIAVIHKSQVIASNMAICVAEDCPYYKECTNHQTAGDFRMEHGRVPNIIAEVTSDDMLRIVCDKSSPYEGAAVLYKDIYSPQTTIPNQESNEMEKLYIIRAVSSNKSNVQYVGLNSVGINWVSSFGDSWMYSSSILTDKTFNEVSEEMQKLSVEQRQTVFGEGSLMLDVLELTVSNRHHLQFGENASHGIFEPGVRISSRVVKQKYFH